MYGTGYLRMKHHDVAETKWKQHQTPPKQTFSIKLSKIPYFFKLRSREHEITYAKTLVYLKLLTDSSENKMSVWKPYKTHTKSNAFLW